MRPWGLCKCLPPAGLGPLHPRQDSNLCAMDTWAQGSSRGLPRAPCSPEPQHVPSPGDHHHRASLLPSWGPIPARRPCAVPPGLSRSLWFWEGHLQRPEPSLSQGHLILRASLDLLLLQASFMAHHGRWHVSGLGRSILILSLQVGSGQQ